MYPIDRIFAIAFAFSRVIGRIRLRYPRGLLAPLFAYSLPTGCYLVTILAEKQLKNTNQTAEKRQRNSRETAEKRQRNSRETAKKQQGISRERANQCQANLLAGAKKYQRIGKEIPKNAGKNTAYYLQKINRQLNFYLILRSH
ncbi:hypothetical protein [Sphingobacterium sp. R2]|uniref:hypothetical protein n=1 Tax=Sphingobacterium sp. R2 TaxID=3112958 RepID=UPI00345CD3D8